MQERLYDLAIETRALYRAGAISRKEARERIIPYEEYYNKKVVEIARKYHQKPNRFNFNAFMR